MMAVKYLWLLIALALLCLGIAYVVWYLWNAHLAYQGERSRRAAARVAAEIAPISPAQAYGLLGQRYGGPREL